jgi:sialate O-acetylesterase
MKSITILLLSFFLLIVSWTAIGQERVINLQTTWRFNLGDRWEWADPAYDDSRWERIDVPSAWEDQGFHGYDGYAWYRFTFDGKRLDQAVQYVLNLGYIDDVNQVYFNGALVGFNGNFPPEFYTAYTALNMFQLPISKINWSGKNVIAVRVFDATMGGGIISGKPGIYISESSSYGINLEGIWKFSTELDENWASPYLDDENWGLIMVPGFWKSKHLKGSTTYGWYRKSFTLTQAMLKKEMVIVLGYIDDFDTSMLNGVFIGRTYDGKRLGKSNSWRQLRIYEVPEGLLKVGDNVLAVQVKDLGGDAGIYNGPIMLIERDRLASAIRKR